VLGVPVEAVAGQHIVDPCGDLGLRQPAPAQPEGDVLGHGRHHYLRVGVGEAESDPLANFASVPPGVEPVDPHAPRGRHHEPVEHAGEGRLAGPVRADDTDARLLEPNVEVEDNWVRPAGVGVRDAVELDQHDSPTDPGTDSTIIATPRPPPAAIAARP